MPWTPKDVKRHTKKAQTKSERAQWVAVANSSLKKAGDEGRAIREANAVVGKGKKK